MRPNRLIVDCQAQANDALCNFNIFPTGKNLKAAITILLLLFQLAAIGQDKAVFKKIPLDSMGITAYKLFPTIEGAALISSSVGLWRMKGRDMAGPEVINGPIY